MKSVMFIEAKKLIGLPLAAQDTQSKIGELRDIVVDPENGKLLGFLVQEGSFLSSRKALSIIDVIDWDPNGLVTATIDNLVELKDIVRIKELVNKNMELLGKKAKTESGKSLGEIENFLIDTDTQTVVKFYLKDLLGHSRIFSADKVVRIDKNIIFSDDVAEPPQGAVGAPA